MHAYIFEKPFNSKSNYMESNKEHALSNSHDKILSLCFVSVIYKKRKFLSDMFYSQEPS